MLRRSFRLGSSSIFAFSTLFTLPFAPVGAVAATVAIPSTTPSSLFSTQLSPSSSIHTLVRRDPDPTRNKFIKPEPFGAPGDFSNNTVYPVGATLEVEWISEWQTVDVSLCQPTTGDTVGCYTLLRQTLSKGYHVQFDGKETDHMSGFGSAPIPNVYFLKLVQTNTLNPTIQSHYFNVSKDGVSEGDGAGSNGTDATTPSAGTNSTGSAMPSGTSRSSPSSGAATSPSDSASVATGWDGLSMGAKLAIYIVVAMIFAGLAGAGIFWLILRSRQKKRAAKLAKIGVVESTSTLTSPIPLHEMHSDSYVHETGRGLPHEISSHEVPMELPAEIPGLAVSSYETEHDEEPWDTHRAQPHDTPR